MRAAAVLLSLCTLLSSSMIGESAKPDSSMVIVSGASFPVMLKKKLDVSKAKTGDGIKLDLIEAVAASGVSSIPAGAKIYGHVVGVSKLAESQESRLAIVIDRMEWKGNSVDLRAVVSGFGVFRRVEYDRSYNECADREYSRRQDSGASSQNNDTAGGRRSSVENIVVNTRPFGCVNPAPKISRSSTTKVENVAIRRLAARPDVTVFTSTTKDIVLKGGTLLLVRNLEQAQVTSAELTKQH